jgi:Protein of unknown function (DUF3592)
LSVIGYYANHLDVGSSVFYLAAVLDDLYDAVSFLWSGRWPETPGEVTAVDVERIQDSDGIETFRLAVAYKFSIRSDGPYTGESFWRPTFSSKRRVLAARHNLRVHQQVAVRYRSDDPTVNKLDRRVWETL